MEDSVVFSNKERKMLFDKINRLSSTEHEEIFRIISSHAVNMSKNKNGIFFNLTTVPNDIIIQIDNFVNYCLSNQESLDEYDKKLNECKLNNKYARNYDYVNMNLKLENIVCGAKDNTVNDGWKVKQLDVKTTQRITYLIDKIQEDREKLHTKRLNTKFINAKKRYSKRVVSEKKFDSEIVAELEVEPYLI
jgi:hypothetical protein